MRRASRCRAQLIMLRLLVIALSAALCKSKVTVHGERQEIEFENDNGDKCTIAMTSAGQLRSNCAFEPESSMASSPPPSLPVECGTSGNGIGAACAVVPLPFSEDYNGAWGPHPMNQLCDGGGLYCDGGGKASYRYCAYKSGNAYYGSCKSTIGGPYCNDGPNGVWRLGIDFPKDEAWLIANCG